MQRSKSVFRGRQTERRRPCPSGLIGEPLGARLGEEKRIMAHMPDAWHLKERCQCRVGGNFLRPMANAPGR